LLHPAACWLLDEPTEGLDAATARDVLQRLRQQMHGHTVIVATHWRREAETADRLLWVEGGRLLAEARRGTTDFDKLLGRLREDAAVVAAPATAKGF